MTLKNSKILNRNTTSDEFHNTQKSSKNGVFEKQHLEVGAKLDITTNTSTITNTDLAFKIGLCLVNGYLTAKQLTERIHENYNSDDIAIDFLAISVSKCVTDLLNSQLVMQEDVDGEIYYKASDEFKKLLGDG